jgi:hypothetical protein
MCKSFAHCSLSDLQDEISKKQPKPLILSPRHALQLPPSSFPSPSLNICNKKGTAHAQHLAATAVVLLHTATSLRMQSPAVAPTVCIHFQSLLLAMWRTFGKNVPPLQRIGRNNGARTAK